MFDDMAMGLLPEIQSPTSLFAPRRTHNPSRILNAKKSTLVGSVSVLGGELPCDFGSDQLGLGAHDLIGRGDLRILNTVYKLHLPSHTTFR